MVSLGQSVIDEEMVAVAETFLVCCICRDENIATFDQLRNNVYYKKSKELDLERFPPTSLSILLHIKRAYFQSYVWLRSPFVDNITLDPLEYGYELDSDDNEVITPKIVQSILPDDFPIPCKCGKCAKANACLYRVNNIQCCQYWNCKAEVCRNPFN